MGAANDTSRSFEVRLIEPNGVYTADVLHGVAPSGLADSVELLRSAARTQSAAWGDFGFRPQDYRICIKDETDPDARAMWLPGVPWALTIQQGAFPDLVEA